MREIDRTKKKKKKSQTKNETIVLQCRAMEHGASR